MGTTWNVSVGGLGAGREAKVDRADIAGTIERVEALMSTWRPTSELSRFNAFRQKTPFRVSWATAEVTARAVEIGEATDGAFDVTLGPLIALWGFDKDGRRRAPPPAEQLAAARKRVGLQHLKVGRPPKGGSNPPAGSGPWLQKSVPDLEVNLSGIAKGFGVDEVARALEAQGLTDFMVEIGGEVRTLGVSPRGTPWRLGVNVPRSQADPTAVLRAVPVRGQALATSGSYRNFFAEKNKRYSHILDPRTGQPVDHHLVSATVLAPDCTTADALATAALVLGEERFRSALAEHFPGVEALFVHVEVPASPSADALEQGKLRVTATAGFPPAS